MKQSHIKSLCVTAICIALCCVLPAAFHAMGVGTAFSPIHIPVLMCGMICGGGYGLVCGLIGPLLSSLITGMPPATGLVSMVPELMVYGLVGGLCMSLIRTKHIFADLYISLVSAMLLGRIVGGIAKVLFFLGSNKSYGFAAWVSAYFVESLPGIICHLILIPLLILVLMKAKVIPQRYSYMNVQE